MERRILTAARAALVAVVAAGCSYDRPPLLDGDAAAGDAAVDGPPAAIDASGTCVIDRDCASGICQAGTCAALDQVSYVAPAGVDANPCTVTAPCATIDRALAVQAASGRPLALVVVEAGAYTQSVALTANAALVVGRAGDNGPPVITPQDRDAVTISGATLTLRRVAIAGGGNGNGDGVRCSNGTVTLEELAIDDMGDDGVDVRDCDATLTRVALRGAGAFGVRALRRALVIRSSVLLANANGGLRTSPVDTLTVTGTVFARNGRPTVGGVGGSAVGGAELLANGAVLFDSNTVADNDAASDGTRAIVCATNGSYALPNNLLTNARNFTTTCPLTHAMSSALAMPSGTNRPIATPAYAAPAAGDYHLTAGSQARGASTAPPAMAAPDLDGEPRPRGGLDVGADEID